MKLWKMKKYKKYFKAYSSNAIQNIVQTLKNDIIMTYFRFFYNLTYWENATFIKRLKRVIFESEKKLKN